MTECVENAFPLHYMRSSKRHVMGEQTISADQHGNGAIHVINGVVSLTQSVHEDVRQHSI